jgi:hypothetical protein
MRKWITILENAGFIATWDGAWITNTGQIIPLVPDGEHPIHHKHVLEDYFPELDDMFHDEWDEDDEVYGEESVNYAMSKGWIRIRIERRGPEFNAQMTVKPTRAALDGLRKYVNSGYFAVFFLDTDPGEGGGNANGARFESSEEMFRAIMSHYYAQRIDERANHTPKSLADVANFFLDTRDDLLEPGEVIMRDMTDRQALAIITREYVSGTCGAFAVALHDKTGYPIIGINGGDHIAVQAPDDDLIDFLGKASPESVMARYGWSNAPMEEWSRSETVEHIMFQDDDPLDPWGEIEIAKWVMKRLGRW